jgi:cobalt-zinc-cadmium efflux system protein
MTGDVHSRNSGRPSHPLTEQKRPLWIALAITAAMMLVETASGFLSGSLAFVAAEDIRALVEVPGVLDVHDLHVWTITSGFVSLSAHLTVRKGTDPRAVLRDANEVLISRFGIRHSTLQIEECGEDGCLTGTCEAPD